MQLQGRELKIHQSGIDVRLLQFELSLLGFDIPEQETLQNFFGQQTQKAVLKFQARVDLERTGVVERHTAKRLNKEINQHLSVPECLKRLAEAVDEVLGEVKALNPHQPDLREHIQHKDDAFQAFAIALHDLSGDDAPEGYRVKIEKMLKIGHHRLQELEGDVDDQDVGEALEKLKRKVKKTLKHIKSLEPDQPDLKSKVKRYTEGSKKFSAILENLKEQGASGGSVYEIEKMLQDGRSRLEKLASLIDDGDENDPDTDANTFSVKGRVAQRDGSAIAGARVRVMAKGIVSKHNQILGEVRCNEEGLYKVRYPVEGDAQPDLVVEVLAPEDEEVVTRSPLIVEASAQQKVDLVVDNPAYPPESEFAQMEARLAPLLKKVSMQEIDSDSVASLSGKTGISPVRISQYIQAQLFSQAGEVPAQIYYGLFRADLPMNKPALVVQDNAVLSEAMRTTSQANVIDSWLSRKPETIERMVKSLNREMVDTILAQPEMPRGEASLGAFLSIAELDEEQKRTVVQHMQSTTSRDNRFWDGLVQQGVGTQAVESMKATAQLGMLTLNNAPLMRTLHKKLGHHISAGQEPLRALVSLTQEEWLGLVREHTREDGDVIVPDSLPTVTNEKPDITYARMISRMVEDAYPTPTLVARAGRDGFAGAAVLSDFLSQHPDFEYRKMSLPAYLRAQKLNIDKEVQPTLERIGRIFELVPRFERQTTIKPLLEADIDSAYKIRSMGERRFKRQLSPEMGEDEAREIYAAAAQKTATATALFAKHGSSFNTIDLAVIPQKEVASIIHDILDLSPEYIDFPTWQSLFGNLDFCDCQHCNSVYSPAAYLVALLKFLYDRYELAELTARRPDIGHIELTCHNTNTTLPYVDLVLEVLETFLVEGEDVQEEDIHQTRGEAPALRVHPEHISTEAYSILEDLIFPWSLPFHLWTEEARAYLRPLGVARHEIMNHFNETSPPDRDISTWLPVATERLNLTPELRDLLLDAEFNRRSWNGLNLDALQNVQTLLDTARISFLELRQLLDTRFINHDGALNIDFSSGEGEDAQMICDLEQAAVQGLTEAHLNRLQRFVRLRRALGYSTYELDSVLHALGGNLDESTLVALSFVQTLHKRLDTSLLVIASWVAELDTHEYLTDKDEIAPSFYATLFLNRSVGGEDELSSFQLDQLDNSIRLAKKEAAILAALQIITPKELALIRKRRLDDDKLTLGNLSELHRVATFTRALKLDVEELLNLLDLSGLDPFEAGSLFDAEQLIDLVETLKAVDFSIAELNYLLRHHMDANSRIAPSESQIRSFLEGLRSDLQGVRSDFDLSMDSPGEQAAQMLSMVQQHFADFLDLDLDASGLLLGGLIRSVANADQAASTLFLGDAFVRGKERMTAEDFSEHYAMVYRLHKVALLMERFDLPTQELEWIVNNHARLEWLDFNALPVAKEEATQERWFQWLRMARATLLRKSWPAGEPTLFSLLRQAEAGEDFASFLTALIERTRWSRADVEALVGSTRLNLEDFDSDWGGKATLSHLCRLQECFGLLRKLGVSAAMAWGWSCAPISSEITAEVKQAVRAKFSEQQWLNTAEPIRDELRQRQRDALVEAVIQKLDDPDIRDSNDLYARFLMDADMNPCMLTSRIVFATAAVQLFVQRIFLGLEDGISFSTEDAALWEWMKNYRLWEANVKVFIRPENLIEPELRPEKSPPFLDLENELLQNDVTPEMVEMAYENYLEKLDEVARLEVVGVYNDRDPNTLHVIARTKGTPYKYFYRQWYESRRWTPWQEVPVDIEGESVAPVIYNRRLYLFWFTTIEKAEEEVPGDSSGESVYKDNWPWPGPLGHLEDNKNEEASEGYSSEKPKRYLEIKLAWCQYRRRKWSPKTISNVCVETIPTRDKNDDSLQPAAYRPRPINRHDDLWIAVEKTLKNDNTSLFVSCFVFLNDGQIELSDLPESQCAIDSPVQDARVWAYYEGAAAGSALRLRGPEGSWQDVLDNAPHAYRVTLPLQYTNYSSRAPFFFADRNRIYFVTPQDIYAPRSSENEMTVLFPPMYIAHKDKSPLRLSEIPGLAVLPEVVGPQAITPGLGSVIHPEMRSPSMETVVSTVMSAVGSHLQSSWPLTMVQGGQTITCGDVGVPMIGSKIPNSPVYSKFKSGMVTSLKGTDLGPDSKRRSMETMYTAEEMWVADVIFGIAKDQSSGRPQLSFYTGTEYTFSSFYHPYVHVLIKQLNRYGVKGILDPREYGEAHDLRRQLMQEPDDRKFDDIYEPGEQINTDLLPMEEFDFEYGQAYSVYNWELFFHIPFMIANHLMQNQRFEEAQKWYHYIFDPTDSSDVPEALNRYRFWKVKPFYQNTDIQAVEQMMRLLSFEDKKDAAMRQRLEGQIEDWQENPFQPHLIAQQRPAAYQKAIVMKYLDNLIAWGDSLFRRDTRESVFEAIQLYTLAAEILGKKPHRIPSLHGYPTIEGERVRTFNDLQPHLGDYGNALVRLETELAGSGTSKASKFEAGKDFSTQGPTPLRSEVLSIEPPTHEIIGSTLFFCVPPNEKLLGYWDTVADRLFKIRNCMNIEGVVRGLELFQPPIDPALLVRAASTGLDLSRVLNDLNAPQPHYRFSVMLGKALELCNDVKGLGRAVLQALEKRDAEELTLLRQTHEQNLQQSIKLVRERQIEEAKETLQGLRKNLEAVQKRQQFYAERNPMIPREKAHMQKMEMGNMYDNLAQGFSLIASSLSLIPEFDAGAEGAASSPTVKAQFGGANLSKVLSFFSQRYAFFGSLARQDAQRAKILATYDRRQEDWDFSAQQAGIECEGIERQIVAAEIRVAVAEQELERQKLQIEQSREIEELMHSKFTNRDLYSWMVTQTSTLYFQAYQLAYDVAKRAERAFQHELAEGSANFIHFGYWDSLKKGLLAGDRLQLDLRRMETAYLERNKRELELTKHISIRQLDPAALIQLRETGSCEVQVPEALFNLDFPGHFMRRIKTVSLTIPCVVGPYTSINATLTLLSNQIRTSESSPNEPYGGLDDDRFISNVGGIQAIAASNGQNDSGLFELNLRDERYLPFEGAGAIGRWRLELWSDFEEDGEVYRYRSFDYDTISDVILHLRYTARDGGEAARRQVVPQLASSIDKIVNATDKTGLYQFFSLARDFGNDLHRFLHPSGANDHLTTLTLHRDHFPYIFQGRALHVQSVFLLLKLRDGSLYDDTRPLSIELQRAGGSAQNQDFQSTEDFGGLPVAKFERIAGEMETEELWQLHVTPEAVQDLPSELRLTVQVNNVDVPRLKAELIKDIGLLINYKIT